jgi:hypothetical protein
MRDSQAYKDEKARWEKLFEETTPSTQEAAKGLIDKASFLHALCADLEEVINKTGAIRVHPENPKLQKQVTAVKEYARLAESYANIANKLNQMLVRNTIEDDDELAEFEDDE